MLSFVDQISNIKVFRVSNQSDGKVVRERLGTVRKKDFSLDQDLDGLAKEDGAAVNEVIDFYKKAARYNQIAAVYAAPETIRKVVEYVTSEGSAFERNMIMMALVEALRKLRKSERETEGGED